MQFLILPFQFEYVLFLFLPNFSVYAFLKNRKLPVTCWTEVAKVGCLVLDLREVFHDEYDISCGLFIDVPHYVEESFLLLYFIIVLSWSVRFCQMIFLC